MKKYLIATLLFVLSNGVFAKNEDATTAHLLYQLNVKGNADHLSFLFEEIDTGETFTLVKKGKRYKDKPTMVPAGRYYLKKIFTPFKNIEALEYAKPKSLEHSFTIKSGAVTYIGAWNVDSEVDYSRIIWDITRSYPIEFLINQKRQNSYLTKYNLYISNEEGKISLGDWSQL